MSVFGPIKTGYEVEQAVIAHLKRWMATYLAELERISELEAESLPMVRSWTTQASTEKWPEDQLPAVLVVSTGLTDQPRSEGDGTTHATWRIGLAAICSARTEAKTHAFAKLYFAALRTIMLQHPSLGGYAEKTVWGSEQYDALPIDEEKRTLAAGYGVFDVTVAEVANKLAGVLEPPDDPYAEPGDWPTVETTEVDIERT